MNAQSTTQPGLNYVYTTPSTGRRYEVWFLKLLLADGGGAWWFRYLLLNLGGKRGGGCDQAGAAHLGRPVQLWATWFPEVGQPQSFIQGFARDELMLSAWGEPLELCFGENALTHDACRGQVKADGHTVAWDLRYQSTVGTEMSDARWIGFSRTPHADAIFSGTIKFDGRVFGGDPVGYGLQGHNCGYRHRNRWTWMHCLTFNDDGSTSCFEALEYDLGLGFHFRRALLRHGGQLYTLTDFTEEFRDRERMLWTFHCTEKETDLKVQAEIDGNGPSLHRLPYLKTNCSGTFDVSNNSLALARLTLIKPGRTAEPIVINAGAVLEMTGD